MSVEHESSGDRCSDAIGERAKCLVGIFQLFDNLYALRTVTLAFAAGNALCREGFLLADADNLRVLKACRALAADRCFIIITKGRREQ